MTTNDKIGDVLKYYRRLNKLSVKQVADMLVEYNIHVKTKTIYGWESNQNAPSADKFLALCYIYKIPDINAEFFKKKSGKSIKISKDESLLLKQYRDMPDMQPAVRRILAMPDPDAESVSKSKSQIQARAKSQHDAKAANAKPQFMAENNTLLTHKVADNRDSFHK
ncbi:helix-turn-helix domain-containing protein [Agathobacter sp.]